MSQAAAHQIVLNQSNYHSDVRTNVVLRSVSEIETALSIIILSIIFEVVYLSQPVEHACCVARGGQPR